MAIVLLGANAGLCMMPLQTYLMKVFGRPCNFPYEFHTTSHVFLRGIRHTTVLTSRLDFYAKSATLLDAWLQAFRDAFIVILAVAVIGAAVRASLFATPKRTIKQ
ncbi:hypothetical protein [Paenibacillus harenae]|uniref:Uncharacterized protein n=1 Tax=Paenibacillus harenae TaxID=306543 RepID=A0ABT9UB45_PAEHA|nr:hypothetical protein [Paenibacillus harenae]MDQ0116823.1 hypothetical protein [Paenibacillus harenae]